jgi:antitoxin HigA-1
VLKNLSDFDLGPPHPGEILRDDLLPRLRMASVDLALKLNLPIETVGELLAERMPITAEIATRLATVFGHSIRFWLGLQLQYDQWSARGVPRPI